MFPRLRDTSGTPPRKEDTQWPVQFGPRSLETRTARLKLPIKSASRTWSPSRQAFYWATGAGPCKGNVRAADGKGGNWIKSFAIADDREDADGGKVLTFRQAQDKARKLARGQDADDGRPVTVKEAPERLREKTSRRAAAAR